MFCNLFPRKPLSASGLIDIDIQQADYVFISATAVQIKSGKEAINQCKNFSSTIVAGGPLFTAGFKEFEGIDHFVLGEAEVTLQPFLDDLVTDISRHIYSSDERPDIIHNPIPMWSLINRKHHSSMNLQYSRGCPFDGKFYDIVILNGHMPRTKSKEQMISEMDALYEHRQHGSLFIVDDNFIGNKKKLKTEILPALIEWKKSKKFPFVLSTEASINLADDEELINLMVASGFDVVFFGIETTEIQAGSTGWVYCRI